MIGCRAGIPGPGGSQESKNSEEEEKKKNEEGELENKEKIDAVYEEDDESVLSIVDNDNDDESVHDGPKIEVK